MKPLRILLSLAALAAVVAPVRAGFPDLGNLEQLGENIGRTAKSVSKVSKGATGLSLEEEVAIGDAVALQIVERYGGVWRNVEATRRVNILGRVLARYATRQDLDWRFGILNTDAINAFSAPGGRIFITRGLYKLAASDDELAGALAHEIEHIDRRHALKIIARGEFLSGVTELAAQNNAKFAQYEEAVKNVSDQILTKGYDPNTEYEADQRGRDLARVTGFAPGGLRAVIEKLRTAGAAGAKETFSTHPSAENRLRKLPADPAPPAATP
jgi:predicted Zn-dependent protease